MILKLHYSQHEDRYSMIPILRRKRKGINVFNMNFTIINLCSANLTLRYQAKYYYHGALNGTYYGWYGLVLFSLNCRSVNSSLQSRAKCLFAFFAVLKLVDSRYYYLIRWSCLSFLRVSSTYNWFRNHCRTVLSQDKLCQHVAQDDLGFVSVMVLHCSCL